MENKILHSISYIVIYLNHCACSDFGDIFDVDWFTSFLSNDVKILKQLPMVGGKVVTPVRTRVPRKASPKYYLNRILPLIKKKHVSIIFRKVYFALEEDICQLL